MHQKLDRALCARYAYQHSKCQVQDAHSRTATVTSLLIFYIAAAGLEGLAEEVRCCTMTMRVKFVRSTVFLLPSTCPLRAS